MTGWNMPLGVNPSDIPGNEMEDDMSDQMWPAISYTCHLDKDRPGIIRFSDGDELSGMLAGIRAPEVVRAVNAYNDLYEALVAAKAELEECATALDCEDYNSPSLNAALAKARGEQEGQDR